jgi:hypothetical protein
VHFVIYFSFQMAQSTMATNGSHATHLFVIENLVNSADLLLLLLCRSIENPN